MVRNEEEMKVTLGDSRWSSLGMDAARIGAPAVSVSAKFLAIPPTVIKVKIKYGSAFALMLDRGVQKEAACACNVQRNSPWTSTCLYFIGPMLV